MQIILLSGGSGSRLWPLSNDARSKQFLRLLPVEGSDHFESMVQRVVRQIRESGIDAAITVATSVIQQDSIIAQLGNEVEIVTEPARHRTFPAICLACEYLSKVKNCPDNESVIVLPCDPFAGIDYFHTIAVMEKAARENKASLILMGIKPTYPSSKYGYVIPGEKIGNDLFQATRVIEKPDTVTAERLIGEGGLWNGGVFTFRLGYITELARKYVNADTFDKVKSLFGDYPVISFDCEVAEKAEDVAVVPFDGEWKDLGTWNTLTDELQHNTYGNVTTDGTSHNTHIINELDLPLLCLGTSDLIVAASPDGILVSEKNRCEELKQFTNNLKSRPMYEERRWGTYKVIDFVEYPDGFCALTKELTLKPGASISYQEHACRDEVWTFINGEGEVILNGERQPVKRGTTIHIPKGMRHALRAISSLTFIEIQSGSNLVETDITRFPLEW